MALRVEINREYLVKAFDLAIGSLTRASNQQGLNPMIRDLYQKDTQIYKDAKIGIQDIK